MEDSFFQTMKLTFELAAFTTLILLFIGIPIAYFLSQTKRAFKPAIEAIVSLPLVLPPSVLGFYLLLAFSPKNSFGSWLETNFDLRLVFSFEGLVVASVIFSLPFMVHPIQSGLSALPKNFSYAAYTLGKSRANTLFFVLLPNIRSSLLTGIVISFAHTIGEFGVVLMMGGNIAGETRVASIAIYDEVEALNYATANQYAMTLFIISFAILLLVYGINRHFMHSGIR